MLTRNSKQLTSFIEYCESHPEERFWQALRNWCGWNFVSVSTKPPHEADTIHYDTFNFEGKNE